MVAVSQRLRRYLGEASHVREEKKPDFSPYAFLSMIGEGRDGVSFQERGKMTRFESSYKPTMFMALLFAALLAGGGIGRVFATVAPGTLVGASTEPTVVSSSPSNNATNVPTSINTSDNVVTGTALTATFSQPMDPETINSSLAGNSPAFTVTEANGNEVPGTVAMNEANTVATFTPTSSALDPNTSYIATVTTAAKNAAGVAMGDRITWIFTTNAVEFTGQTPVPLGTAGPFAILTKSGITDVFPSVINGDVGASPITGAAIHLKCSEIKTGKVYSVNAAGPLPCRVTDASLLTKAVGDMEIAYTNAAGRKNPNFINLGAGKIGGLVLVPGLYKWTTGVLISRNVTLKGGADAVWIFQIAGTLTQDDATQVILKGGGLPKNIFWQTSGAVAIGTTARFEGVILAKKKIAMKTSASANGRLLAQTAVTLQQNAVTRP
jgi:Ice-binding-like/Bacterial Ig-like domain